MSSATIIANAQKFLWLNFKMYLQQYGSCLLDSILDIKNPDSDLPSERYKDFFNQFEEHVKLGSYAVDEATQYSKFPLLIARFGAVSTKGCMAKGIATFDIAYSTDAPCPDDGTTRNIGNSSESVAIFMSNITNGLNQLMFEAYDHANTQGRHPQQAFFDRLKDQTLPNPKNPEQTRPWTYNITAAVEDDISVTEVEQIKREDRSDGMSVFHVTYHLNIYALRGNGIDCGC